MLTIKDLSYTFRDPNKNTKTLALKNINLTIRNAEFVSVVGPSGCGKTTLLHCISGLLPSYEGSVLKDGGAAMVFQSHSLFPWRNVLDNITYGLELAGIDRERRKKVGNPMIKLMGLSGFEKFYPHQLSGGMQQRVNLARALALDPKILLLDEPFANLDAQTREMMQEELLGIWQRKKKTVVFVTHQISEAIYLSDRVVVLSKRPGKIKKIVHIDLKRPRNLEVKMTKGFVQIEKRIWDLCMEEVRR